MRRQRWLQHAIHPPWCAQLGWLQHSPALYMPPLGSISAETALAGQRTAEAAASTAQHSAQEALKQVGELQAQLEAQLAAAAAPEAAEGAGGQSSAQEQQVGGRARGGDRGRVAGGGMWGRTRPTALWAEQQRLPWAPRPLLPSTAALPLPPTGAPLQADIFDLLVQLQEAETALAEAQAGGRQLQAGGREVQGEGFA